mmetsp:Transcript_18063/g.51712  ORF Transcript_18063/g.51712 Transcript_18063/m.51712 type:complete len:547 (+) Transcript_18063:140-1780(+)
MKMEESSTSHGDAAVATGTTHCEHVPKRVQYQVETETTTMQRETEDECEPFFVDLTTLPPDQLLHLRNVGLLPRASKPSPAGGGLDTQEVILEDVTDADDVSADGGVKIELIEEVGDAIFPNPNEDDAAYHILLLRQKHIEYLTRALDRPLSPSYVSLDASRPWIIYWSLHSLDLLDGQPNEGLMVNIVKAIESLWSESSLSLSLREVKDDPLLGSEGNVDGDIVHIIGGGFGGNIGQMTHCATTYAAVLALCIVHGAGSESSAPSSQLALGILRSKRRKLYAWYLSLRCEVPFLASSSLKCQVDRETMTAFRMHHDGEIDVRATYTMMAVASLLQIDTPLLASTSAADFVACCQTYEGGFGGEPHSEAHGGYTFCALAALRLLDESASGLSDSRVQVDTEALRSWISRRQMNYEGGFAGRSNKLVDGCYSFWQGGVMAVLDLWEEGEGDGDSSSELCFDRESLQRYILLCAQDVNGGLRDKPSKPRDFYHSCYNLSGLSVTQHVLLSKSSQGSDEGAVPNIIGETHPTLNIRQERVSSMRNADLF